jgi:rSAM/selenodomain-associated transferase 1
MKRPAVAVMAKVPGTAIVKSRLHTVLSPEQATLLYRCFLLDRLDGLAGVGDIERVVAFTPPEGGDQIAALAPAGYRCVAQQGRDLGERLSGLLAGLLAQGHAGAIAIDSDSPTLPMAYVAAAAEMLARAAVDVVIGPAEDGGYYLIGLTAPQPRLFEAVVWSTASVLPTTLARVKELGLRAHLLPPWFDVDTADDLARLYDEVAADGADSPRTSAYLRTLYGCGRSCTVEE